MTDVHIEQAEMAAFEKGRMQGEMEAVRRLENEGNNAVQLKQFPADQLPVQTIPRPDVVEINRLTIFQQVAAACGELSALAYVAMTVVWLDVYRGDVGWSDDENGDNVGNDRMWNSHFLASCLGLFFLTQAVLMYRIVPLNVNPWINRIQYTFFQLCAISCWCVSLAGLVKSTPTNDAKVWSSVDWCFLLAFCVTITHAIYSIVVTFMEGIWPVDYETWTETNNNVTNTLRESAEQRRDQSTFNQAGRTIYTPAPAAIPHGDNLPLANSNVGAEVPQAPANAPRWAENPNTHSENYFLLPRVKWALCGFVAMGAAILMEGAALQQIMATGHSTWSHDFGGQVPNGDGKVDYNSSMIDETGRQARLVSAMGLIYLFSILTVLYAAMPPRTTLVKNGILQDANRRSSISHTAETRLGPNMV